MTVKELIKKLKEIPEEASVLCDYENIIAAIYEEAEDNNGNKYPTCFLIQEN